MERCRVEEELNDHLNEVDFNAVNECLEDEAYQEHRSRELGND